jgi:uncharacterized metal-binding protein
MASGKSHDRSIYFCSPLIGILGAPYLSPTMGLIAASSHLLGGLYLSPDLDLKSLPWRRWGVLRFIWLPYQKAISHRHWLSHAPIIGSIVRLLYLGLWLSPLLIVIPSFHPNSDFWQSISAAMVGVEVSVLNHLLLDGLLVPLPKAIKARLKGD